MPGMGGVELAYTVTGDGPLDVVLVPGLLGHLEYNEETPYEWSVPPQERVGPDDEDGPTITTYGACERGEDHAVVGFETRTLDLALQPRELMTQHEDLDILGTIASSAQHEQVDHEADKTIETARGPILAAPRTRPFTRYACSTPSDEYSAPTGPGELEIVGKWDMKGNTSKARHLRNALVRIVPIVGWLPKYEKSWLAPDLLAGLSVWALVVPQALGYADVVGVPAQYGLYTILGASVLYAVFASTHQVVTGPSASVAAVTAPVAALYVAATSPDYLSTVIALTLCVGVVYVLLGVFRMGWVSNFLAKAVLEGFIFAVGFGLIVDQLPKILGIPKADGSYWDVLVGVVKDLDLTNRTTLVVGAAAVGLLLLMRFKAPRIPRSFVVVLLGILVVSVFDLTKHGVVVVGDVPTGLPSLALPSGLLGHRSGSPWRWARSRSSSSATASRSPPPRTPRRGTSRSSRRTRSSSRKAQPGSAHLWWAASPDAAA